MAFNFNGNTPKKILYNGLNVAKLVYNGVVVWMSKVLATISGVLPLTLTDCTDDDLVDYKIYGNTEETGSLNPLLPTGYTPVEYIQGTGTQYIDIGRKMYNNSEIELCFSFDVIQQDCSIFGSRDSATVNNFEIASSKPAFPLYLDFGNYNTSRATYNNVVINTKYICTISKSLRAVYDENHTLLARNTTLISADNVTKLYARIFDTAGGFSANKFQGKVYYCKIWEGENLIRNFIPCTNSSNVAGMYDTVTNAFYTNAGTGTFNVGSVVSKKSVGDLVTDTSDINYGKYKIPILTNSTATNIYLNKPLRRASKFIAGAEVEKVYYTDYLDYENQKVVRNVDDNDKGIDTSIEESVVLPAVPTDEGTTIFDVDTDVTPSYAEVKYYTKPIIENKTLKTSDNLVFVTSDNKIFKLKEEE